MYILAIDTSTDACSIALKSPQKTYVINKIMPRKHNEIILPMIDNLLEQANIAKSQIKYIAYGIGPGSFVGVRLSAAIVHGLAFALDCKVLSFSSMYAQALSAQNQIKEKKISVILDARMQDLYVGNYYINKNNILQISKEDYAIKINDYLVDQDDAVYIGDGCKYVIDKIGKDNYIDSDYYPDMTFIFPYLDEQISSNKIKQVNDVMPIYLQGVRNWQKIKN